MSYLGVPIGRQGEAEFDPPSFLCHVIGRPGVESQPKSYGPIGRLHGGQRHPADENEKKNKKYEPRRENRRNEHKIKVNHPLGKKFYNVGQKMGKPSISRIS